MYNIISEETYPDGAIIVEEGGAGDWIYTILTGKVEVFKTINGRKVVADMLEEGDILGEISFLSQTKRTASARAIGEVKVGIIDRDYLDEEFNKLSGDFKNILIAIVSRLTKTTEAVCGFIDKHRNPRVTCSSKIVFKSGESVTTANSDNISSRGVFIRTGDPFKKGEQFFFKLEIPGIPDPIKGACEVVWSRRLTDSPKTRPIGMGCRFIKMSREDWTALKIFVTEVIQKGEPA